MNIALKNKVLIYDGMDYDLHKLIPVIVRGFDELNLSGQELSRGMRILVKPNILASVDPARRVTTHPFLVAAVVSVLRDMGCTVIVGDSSGGGMLGYAQTCEALNKTGIKEATETAGGTAVALEAFGAVAYRGQLEDWTLWLTPLIEEIDAIVNLPVMKTHTATVITGAVKNLFGMVPGHLKAQYHAQFPHIPRFSKLLVDIALKVKPTVNIVDAILCMDGDGPMNGRPYAAHKLLMGRDPISVDLVLSTMAGIEPEKVPTIQAAKNAGIQVPSIHEVTNCKVSSLQGFQLPQTVRNDWIGRGLFVFGIHWKRVLPKISYKDCLGCSKCESACPVGAIINLKGLCSIDRNMCISCLCCHELCPENAIILQRIKPFQRLLGFFRPRNHAVTQCSIRQNNGG